MFRSGKGSAGLVRLFGSGVEAETDRGCGNWEHTVASGKAEWKSRLKRFKWSVHPHHQNAYHSGRW
jgi:hypothetical protein